MPDAQATQNLLLAALPAEELQRLWPHLSPFPLELGAVLIEPGDTVQQVYFVQHGLLSYVLPASRDVQVEVGLIGREGVGGLAMALANTPSPFQIMVQAAGSALVTSADAFRAAVLCGGGLYESTINRVLELTHHCAQNALCNRQHSREESLCRWLLMVQDRVPGDVLTLHHSFLSMMLGERAGAVNISLGILKRAGLIDFDGDSIQILNRKGLEGAACECYPSLRDSSLHPR